MHLEKENIDPERAKASYSSLVSPSLAKELLGWSKFKKVRQKSIQDFVDDTKVENLDIQKVMDDCGIRKAGYSNMFKAVKRKLKEKKVSSILLPMPAQVRKSRRDLNEEVAAFLGPSIHIRADFQSGNRKVNFNDSNNIFFDLQTLQKYMVKFYNISQCEVESKLIFVLKLDKCEILKQKKKSVLQ